MSPTRLRTKQVAALLGIKPGTWRSYVSRGYAPQPDDHDDDRSPVWFATTIDRYRAGRRQGARTDLKKPTRRTRKTR